MTPLRYLVPLGMFMCIVAFLGVGLRLDPRDVPSPLIGKQAPAFALPQLDDANAMVSRDDLLGHVWMLNVWASWCAPCREEHPLVIDIARRQLVQVVGLNHKDTPAAARAWLASLGNPYQATLVDADGRVGIDFGVYGVPETFIIDRQGIVRLKHTGPLTRAVVRTRIEPLLKELNAPPA